MLNKRLKVEQLPQELKDFWLKVVTTDQASIWFVAKAGVENDFAVYMGQPDIEYIQLKYKRDYNIMAKLGLNSLKGTAQFGNKLREELARLLFPEFADLRYRP